MHIYRSASLNKPVLAGAFEEGLMHLRVYQEIGSCFQLGALGMSAETQNMLVLGDLGIFSLVRTQIVCNKSKVRCFDGVKVLND